MTSYCCAWRKINEALTTGITQTKMLICRHNAVFLSEWQSEGNPHPTNHTPGSDTACLQPLRKMAGVFLLFWCDVIVPMAPFLFEHFTVKLNFIQRKNTLLCCSKTSLSLSIYLSFTHSLRVCVCLGIMLYYELVDVVHYALLKTDAPLLFFRCGPVTTDGVFRDNYFIWSKAFELIHSNSGVNRDLKWQQKLAHWLSVVLKEFYFLYILMSCFSVIWGKKNLIQESISVYINPFTPLLLWHFLFTFCHLGEGFPVFTS